MRIDPSNETHYLKVAQVAERLGLSQSAVYKLCESKQLPSVRVTTKAIRVPSWVLDAYLKKLNGEAFSPLLFAKTGVRLRQTRPTLSSEPRSAQKIGWPAGSETS